MQARAMEAVFDPVPGKGGWHSKAGTPGDRRAWPLLATRHKTRSEAHARTAFCRLLTLDGKSARQLAERLGSRGGWSPGGLTAPGCTTLAPAQARDILSQRLDLMGQ